MTIKYPELIGQIPDEVVNRFAEALEEGNDEFKQLLLQTSHAYALQMVANYELMRQRGSDMVARELLSAFTLENLEDDAVSANAPELPLVHQ